MTTTDGWCRRNGTFPVAVPQGSNVPRPVAHHLRRRGEPPAANSEVNRSRERPLCRRISYTSARNPSTLLTFAVCKSFCRTGRPFRGASRLSWSLPMIPVLARTAHRLLSAPKVDKAAPRHILHLMGGDPTTDRRDNGRRGKSSFILAAFHRKLARIIDAWRISSGSR